MEKNKLLLTLSIISLAGGGYYIDPTFNPYLDYDTLHCDRTLTTDGTLTVCSVHIKAEGFRTHNRAISIPYAIKPYDIKYKPHKGKLKDINFTYSDDTITVDIPIVPSLSSNIIYITSFEQGGTVLLHYNDSGNNTVTISVPLKNTTILSSSLTVRGLPRE